MRMQKNSGLITCWIIDGCQTHGETKSRSIAVQFGG